MKFKTIQSGFRPLVIQLDTYEEVQQLIDCMSERAVETRFLASLRELMIEALDEFNKLEGDGFEIEHDEVDPFEEDEHGCQVSKSRHLVRSAVRKKATRKTKRG